MRLFILLRARINNQHGDKTMQILTAAQSVKIICSRAPTKAQAKIAAEEQIARMIEAEKKFKWEKVDGKWVRL